MKQKAKLLKYHQKQDLTIKRDEASDNFKQVGNLEEWMSLKSRRTFIHQRRSAGHEIHTARVAQFCSGLKSEKGVVNKRSAKQKTISCGSLKFTDQSSRRWINEDK